MEELPNYDGVYIDKIEIVDGNLRLEVGVDFIDKDAPALILLLETPDDLKSKYKSLLDYIKNSEVEFDYLRVVDEGGKKKLMVKGCHFPFKEEIICQNIKFHFGKFSIEHYEKHIIYLRKSMQNYHKYSNHLEKKQQNIERMLRIDNNDMNRQYTKKYFTAGERQDCLVKSDKAK